MTPTFVLPSRQKKKNSKFFFKKKTSLERSRQKKSALFEASSHRTPPNWRRIEAASIHGVLSRAVLLGRRREGEGKNAHQIGRRGRL